MRALADELQNISRAGHVAGISRSHFFEIKTAFEMYGRDGLAPAVRPRPRMPNETPIVGDHPLLHTSDHPDLRN
jgi:hypothetical protein